MLRGAGGGGKATLPPDGNVSCGHAHIFLDEVVHRLQTKYNFESGSECGTHDTRDFNLRHIFVLLRVRSLSQPTNSHISGFLLTMLICTQPVDHLRRDTHFLPNRLLHLKITIIAFFICSSTEVLQFSFAFGMRHKYLPCSDESKSQRLSAGARKLRYNANFIEQDLLGFQGCMIRIYVTHERLVFGDRSQGVPKNSESGIF